MADRKQQLTDQYLAMNKERDELTENIRVLGREIAKETYPFNKGDKVLVKSRKGEDYVPAYFDHASTEYSNWNGKQNVIVRPYLRKMKKDGSISSQAFPHISTFDIERGDVDIKPFNQ